MEMIASRSPTSHLLPIDDLSRVGEARRLANKLAQEAGADADALGRIGIVVTEAATNLARHAQNGKLLLRISTEGAPGIELVCLDSGPGFPDLERCLTDGYSTAGTPGNGLGAIRRISDEFALHSLPGKGTTLYSRIGFSATKAVRFAVGAVSVPHPGERLCGDNWVVLELPDRLRASVVDGLGHGPSAAAAAREAVRILKENTKLTPAEAMQAQHRALRTTRGAAVMTVDVYHDGSRVRASGIGNVSGFLVGPASSRGILSHPGIVGHEMRTVHELDFTWPENGILVLHSDGLTNRWSLAPYPGLLSQAPALIAATLFRDAARARDDATVLVVARRK